MSYPSRPTVPQFISPPLILSHLIKFISPHLISTYPISSQFFSSHLLSSYHHIILHLVSSHLNLFNLFSYHFISIFFISSPFFLSYLFSSNPFRFHFNLCHFISLLSSLPILSYPILINGYPGLHTSAILFLCEAILFLHCGRQALTFHV